MYDKSSQIDLLTVTMKKPGKEVKIDIIPLVQQIIIYEDLFQANISAKLVFSDQLNLVGSFPIVGGEIINLSYKTPIYKDAVNLEFIVYQIGERGVNNSSENIQMNTLMLCTPEVWFAATHDSSEAHEGTYTDIISRMIRGTNSKKKTTFEQSVGIVKYVVPGINCFKAIKFCAKRANTKTASPMFFWETAANGYNLQSLKEMYRTTIAKNVYIEDRSVNGVDRDSDKVFNTAYSFELPASNNRLDQYNQNAFGADNYSVDLSNARIIKNTNSYVDVFNRDDIKLNKYPLNDQTESSRWNNGFIPYRKDLSHSMAYNRLANLAMMDNVSILLNIPGDSQLKVGDIIWLEIPAKVGLQIGTEAHTSGKWLLRSMKHLISRTTYTMVCELTKDSFDSDVSK